jgi:hypothetical protein
LHILLVNRPGAFLRHLQRDPSWKVEDIPKAQIRRDIANFVEDAMQRSDSLSSLDTELQDMVLARLAGDENDQ